jgi:transposase
MGRTELETITKAYEDAAAVASRLRKERDAAIIQADAEGMSQVDITKATGYTRETIRRIVKASKEGRGN